jgi:hypothetical protein
MAWAQKLQAAYTNKIVIFGGSSCGTSIDGERLLAHHHLPVVNLGLGAGMGAKALTLYAFAQIHPGDTLIVALEPDLLTQPIVLEPLAAQFAVATGQPALLKNPNRPDWLSAIVHLRPGGYHVFTLLGKIATRQPLYRYSPSEFHASGWHEVIVRRDLAGLPIGKLTLSADGEAWLAFIRDECARRHARVAYSLPWGYSPPQQLSRLQQWNLDFLRQVNRFIPALRETNLGGYTNRAHYADTFWHPTAEGARIRTDALAAALKSWETWSPEELASPSLPH